MIRQLATGLYRDDDVAEGSVLVEEYRPGRVELHCGPVTALRVLTDGHWDAIHEMFAPFPGQTFAIPPQYLANGGVPGEILDLVSGLRSVQPAITSHCQYPPCMLPTERVAAGYSLCWLHREDLAGHEHHL